MADDFMATDVSDTWNQYRNIIGVPSRRRIICGIALVVFVLTLIVISFAVMSKQSSFKNVKQTYASFQSALNTSVDPCMDFYNFSCGLWAENNPMPEYSARVTAFSLLQDRVNMNKKTLFENAKVDDDLPRAVNDAIRFYNICSGGNITSGSGIQLLLEYFDQIGGWPILNKNKWDEDAFDWFHSSAFLIKYLDLHTVIGVHSTDSDKVDGKNIIYLKTPGILQNEEGMLNNVPSEQMLYIILESLNNSVIYSDISEDVENLKAVETKWHELLSVSRKTSHRLEMSVEELTQKIPNMNWLKYLQLITNDTLHEVNETITIHDRVAVENFEFLRSTIDLLNSDTFSKLELANLFGWFMVKDIWILIPGVLQNYAKVNDYSLEDIRRAASSQCYDLALELFPCSFDYLYVKNSSDLEIQDNIVLTKYLKSAFQDIIKNSKWLDEFTKDSVLTRLSKMKDIIGFPNYMTNKTEFDKMYENFPTMDDFGLIYYFKILQYYIKIGILCLKVPTIQLKSVLPRSISDVSAYYIVTKNTLVYPVSLHNPPFYYFKGPWYLNFGAVGTVIGHEIMHGFDSFGNEGDDLKVAWLSNASRKSYQERAECFRDQYDAYDNSGLHKNNGTRTLRENIADNEGLHLAFKAYKKHAEDFGAENFELFNNYTPDQMFFIAYGTVWCSKISPAVRKALLTDHHSSPELRVNKAVSNSKSFALAFNCAEGSHMNPVKKCSIW